MAGHVKSTESRFIDKHSQLKRDVMLRMLDYIKTLQKAANPGTKALDVAAPIEIPRNVTETEDGFPKTPRLDEPEQNTKALLENSLRLYLTAHYSKSLPVALQWAQSMCFLELASGCRRDHVPYAELMANPRDFVEPKYLPRGWKFKDPRNMTKDEILAFFQHVQQREEVHGAKDAFRFCKYRMKKEMHTAEYGVDANDELARQKALKAKAARDAKKNKQKQPKNPRDRQTLGEGQTLIDQPVVPAGSTQLDGLLPFEPGTGSRETSNDVTNMNDPDNRVVPRPQPLDPNIDPALQEPLAHFEADLAHDKPLEGVIRVNEAEMTLLINEHGYVPIPPANGPNEGSPEYEVPAQARGLLQGTQGSQMENEAPDDEVGEALTVTRRGRRPAQSPETTRNLRSRQTPTQPRVKSRAAKKRNAAPDVSKRRSRSRKGTQR